MLILTHQLTQEQLAAVNSLMMACKKSDCNVIPIYQHLLSQNRNQPNILYYKGQQLIAFLSAFFFHEDAYEIAIMVNPKHRRQGIASKMLKKFLCMNHQKIDKLIFSTPQGLHDKWLPKLDFCYQDSEYQMQTNKQVLFTGNDKSLPVRLATVIDIPFLSAIDSACFPKQKNDMNKRFYRLLNDPNYSLFIAEQNHVPIGKAHLCYRQDGVRLTDVAIIPRVQGQGLGSALIAHCINHVLKEHKQNIFLDVSTSNQNALSLYTRLGFTINNAYDYWTTRASCVGNSMKHKTKMEIRHE